ncbi:MAG: hypothetical protein ACM65L_13255 [Microcoleus sp.]
MVQQSGIYVRIDYTYPLSQIIAIGNLCLLALRQVNLFSCPVNTSEETSQYKVPIGSEVYAVTLIVIPNIFRYK